MPPMGRRRKDTASGLEPRVYMRAGSYYYVHRLTGKWEPLGKEKARANERAQHYNDPAGLHGTLVYWLDEFLVHCEARVKTGSMAQRTLDDYTLAIAGIPPKGDKPGRPGALRVFFAPPLAPTQVVPAMVQDFLQANAELGRPVPANREKAALSAAMSWMISKARVPGLLINPCLRASGIKRNSETKRDLYVPHQDYQDVYAVAHNSVRLMMELTYRTLHWDNTVLGVVDGKRVLRFKQGKTYARTGKTMQIEVPADLSELIRQSLGEVPKLRQPLVRTRDGHAYTYDGLSAMLKRSIAKASKARKAKGLEPVQSFGFRDLKGKGATDMWLAGVPLEQIQALCGHEDKTTTEIYVKQRWRETVQPNRVAM
jgi:integrase